LRIYDLKLNYQPAELDIVNDCNQYRDSGQVPGQLLAQSREEAIFFERNSFFANRARMPSMVSGRRMSIQLVHFSPEGVFLIIEVRSWPARKTR